MFIDNKQNLVPLIVRKFGQKKNSLEVSNNNNNNKNWKILKYIARI